MSSSDARPGEIRGECISGNGYRYESSNARKSFKKELTMGLTLGFVASRSMRDLVQSTAVYCVSLFGTMCLEFGYGSSPWE